MYRIGMIGTGYIAGVHARSIAQEARLRLVAVHGRNGAKCADFAQVHGARPVEDPDALISAEDIDAIIVASATDTHSDLALRVAAAGKPVYCEKPIDLALDRAATTAARLQRAGARAMIGFNRRYEPSHAAVAKAVRVGEIGRLQILQMTSRGPQTVASPDYIRTSGGFFRDKGVHFFDLARFISGEEVVAVSAMGAALANDFIRDYGDFDTAAITMQLASGALCQIDNTRQAAYGYDERVEAFGILGMVQSERLPANAVTYTSGHSLQSGPFPQTNFERVGTSFPRIMTAFADWLADPATPVPSIADGLEAQVIAEAAEISAREGRTVPLAEIRVRMNQDRATHGA